MSLVALIQHWFIG